MNIKRPGFSRDRGLSSPPSKDGQVNQIYGQVHSQVFRQVCISSGRDPAETADCPPSSPSWSHRHRLITLAGISIPFTFCICICIVGISIPFILYLYLHCRYFHPRSLVGEHVNGPAPSHQQSSSHQLPGKFTFSNKLSYELKRQKCNANAVLSTFTLEKHA